MKSGVKMVNVGRLLRKDLDTDLTREEFMRNYAKSLVQLEEYSRDSIAGRNRIICYSDFGADSAQRMNAQRF